MKLIPKIAVSKLMDAYQHSGETGKSSREVVVKLFTPWAGATWYITEGMPVNDDGEPMSADELEDAGVRWLGYDAVDWHLFGWCDLGNPQMAELGYVMLSDLKGLNGPAGLKVERDRNYHGNLDDVMADYRRARYAH